MMTSETNEAVAIANALKPTVEQWMDDRERNCVRAKKMTVTAAKDAQGMIEVREAFDSASYKIPVTYSLGSVQPGDVVWCVWLFNDLSTMVALWPGTLAFTDGGGGGGGSNVQISVSGTSLVINTTEPEEQEEEP